MIEIYRVSRSLIELINGGQERYKKYSTMCKVAKALDTIFHGVQVESCTHVAAIVSLTLSDENQQKYI